MKLAPPLVVTACVLSALVLGGCGAKSGRRVATEQEVDPGSPGRTLVLFNWEEYMGSETVANFEKETGIDVQEVFFKDEEESLGAVQADPAAYDLVVISDDLVREMRKARILSPLDKSKIPNMRNIGERYRNLSFDPGLGYSVPYLWGSTGMVINRKYIQGDTDSWKVLFDRRYAGRIAMLPNPYEAMAVACRLLGYSLNTKDPNELGKARVLLLEQKTLLKGYLDYVVIQDLMLSEELWAAQMFSGEGTRLMEENGDLQFVLPKEGAALWLDTLVIPRDARHKMEAHRFLDYILRPEVGAAIASELWYATANEKAEPLMDTGVSQAPNVYPPIEVLARCEYFQTPAEATPIIVSIWQELQE